MNRKYQDNFQNLVESMTALSWEPIFISKCWVSSLEMLSQAFTAAIFSSCFLSTLPPLILSSLSEKHAQLGWGQDTDLTVDNYSISLPLEALGLFFLSMFWIVIHLYCEAISSSAFCWIWAETIALYTTDFILLCLSAVKSSINISDPVPNISHTCPCHNTASTKLDRCMYSLDHEPFLSFSIQFSSHHSGKS